MPGSCLPQILSLRSQVRISQLATVRGVVLSSALTKVARSTLIACYPAIIPMAGATTGRPRDRKPPLRAKCKSGGNASNLDDPSLTKLDNRKMNGNFPSPSYNNNGNVNNICLTASSFSVTGNQIGDCVGDDSGVPMNTFVSFDLKRPESNYDEGFIKGGNYNRRALRGGKISKSAGDTGKNLVMENVTILKRGEKIEDVVCGVRSVTEENDTPVETSPHVSESLFRDGTRVSGGYFHGRVSEGCPDDSRRATNKKGQPQAVVGVSKFASARTVQKKKTKAPFKTSQVCPVSPSYDSTANSNNLDGALCLDEVDKFGNGLVVTSADRLGPDPSRISKEVSSGILRPVSTGSRSSEEINDGNPAVILPELVTRAEGSVKSGTRPASSPAPQESPVPNSLWEWWAGPAYTSSPSPRCLPLPKFFMRHKVRSDIMDSNGLGGDECKNNGTVIAPEAAIRDNKKQMPLDVKQSYVDNTHQIGVDAFATKNLLRLLQLE